MTGDELVGFPSCSLTATGLVFDDELDFDSWEHVGYILGATEGAVRFALGDWMLAGEKFFGEEAAQAVEVTGLKRETLLQYIRVSRSVTRSRRRRTLSWSHHQAVAALDPDEQDRLLNIAEEQRLPLEEFRGLIREPARHLAVENQPPPAEVVDAPEPDQLVIDRPSLREVAEQIATLEPDEHGRTCIGSNLREQLRRALDKETA